MGQPGDGVVHVRHLVSLVDAIEAILGVVELDDVRAQRSAAVTVATAQVRRSSVGADADAGRSEDI